MPKIIKAISILFVCIGLLLTILAYVTPINQYQEMNGLDCDGPLKYLILIVASAITILAGTLGYLTSAPWRSLSRALKVVLVLMLILPIFSLLLRATDLNTELKKNEHECAQK